MVLLRRQGRRRRRGGQGRRGMMEHPGFFERAAPLPLAALAQKVGAELAPTGDRQVLIHDVRALSEAGKGHITFLDNRKYLAQLAATQATACLIAPAFASRVPAG